MRTSVGGGIILAFRRTSPERLITVVMRRLERAKGFEPSTPTLARLCSTPELRPLGRKCGDSSPLERARYQPTLGFASSWRGLVRESPTKGPFTPRCACRLLCSGPYEPARSVGVRKSVATLGLTETERESIERFEKDVI